MHCCPKLFRVFPRPGGLIVALLLGVTLRLPAAEQILVPRGQRYELTFQCEHTITNPLAVSFRVEFRSPQGDRQVAPGFWDGGRTWRARIAPGLAGPWSYRTECSLTNDHGLHGRLGEFLCTAGERGNRWHERGPLRVARAGTYFEHTDGTPFFLAAQLAWHAPRRESTSAFEERLRQLAAQHFNALAWTLWPGRDERGEGPFSTNGNGGLNLPFLQRLDARVDMLSRAGILNIIAPAWELQPRSEPASEDQVAMLWEQALARWHANPSLWLVAVSSDSSGANIGRWQRIAGRVFAARAPGPVIFLPGESHWLWEEFRAASWISALGFQSAHLLTDDTLQWLLSGPLSKEFLRKPARSVLDLYPITETSSDTIASARRLLWWGLLLNPPAGVSWQSDATGIASPVSAAPHAVDFMSTIPFWRLKPAPELLAVQPGWESPRHFIPVAASESRDLIVAYVPDSRSVQLTGLNSGPRLEGNWFNPRTGRRVQAGGTVAGSGATYRTPDEDDWVLVLRGQP